MPLGECSSRWVTKAPPGPTSHVPRVSVREPAPRVSGSSTELCGEGDPDIVSHVPLQHSHSRGEFQRSPTRADVGFWSQRCHQRPGAPALLLAEPWGSRAAGPALGRAAPAARGQQDQGSRHVCAPGRGGRLKGRRCWGGSSRNGLVVQVDGVSTGAAADLAGGFEAADTTLSRSLSLALSLSGSLARSLHADTGLAPAAWTFPRACSLWWLE
eukprot:3922762-Rhodomonas_salina.1